MATTRLEMKIHQAILDVEEFLKERVDRLEIVKYVIDSGITSSITTANEFIVDVEENLKEL